MAKTIVTPEILYAAMQLKRYAATTGADPATIMDNIAIHEAAKPAWLQRLDRAKAFFGFDRAEAWFDRHPNVRATAFALGLLTSTVVVTALTDSGVIT